MKFLYASIITFLISLVFLFVQGIINYKFYRFNDRKVILERYLFDQFSKEVYSSINSYISLELKDKCNKVDKGFYLNLDTYFDCKGIYNSDLNKDCQNKIIKNSTLCPADQIKNLNLNNIGNLLDYDERAIYCKYYSKHKRNIIEFYNKKICVKKDSYNYEQLLANSISPNEKICPIGFKKCGILDTKRNILCWDSSKECPNILEIDNNQKDSLTEKLINNLKNDINSDIIISIIISENPPLNHEFDYDVRKKYTKLKDEEIQKFEDITGEDYKLFDTEYDNTFKYLDKSEDLNFTVRDFIDDTEQNKYNSGQNLNVYTRNYIGFKNVEELNKFKKKFPSQNESDNPLYKLSNSKHNPLVTIIFSAVFFAISIAYLILRIINILPSDIYEILFKIYFTIEILFFIAILIVISVHFSKYPQIHIDMDKRMKIVLDKYNKRTMDFQLYRIISLGLNSIAIVLMIISSCKSKKHNHQD